MLRSRGLRPRPGPAASISVPRQLPELEGEGEIFLGRHVRIERVVLEHHRDVPLAGGTSFISRPPILSSSPEIVSRPAIIRSVVLLPQPDGPTSTTNSPSPICRSRSRTAVREPPRSSYIFRTPRQLYTRHEDAPRRWVIRPYSPRDFCGAPPHPRTRSRARPSPTAPARASGNGSSTAGAHSEWRHRRRRLRSLSPLCRGRGSDGASLGSSPIGSASRGAACCPTGRDE